MVLQFGFTLEHLRNVFYKQALEKFRLNEFEQADPPNYAKTKVLGSFGLVKTTDDPSPTVDQGGGRSESTLSAFRDVVMKSFHRREPSGKDIQHNCSIQ
ncbi:hypothetical protein LTR56_028196, partial [Elasticomyces elasticus]